MLNDWIGAESTACQLAAPSVVLYRRGPPPIVYIVAGLVGSMVSGRPVTANPASASLQLVPPSTLLYTAVCTSSGPGATAYRVPGVLGSIAMSENERPLGGT